jgi:hypothetical protein
MDWPKETTGEENGCVCSLVDIDRHCSEAEC